MAGTSTTTPDSQAPQDERQAQKRPVAAVRVADPAELQRIAARIRRDHLQLIQDLAK